MSSNVVLDRLAVWLAEHPQTRRLGTIIATVHGLALWAVISAPSAAASAGGAALAWTGLRDSYGVPLANYFLSVVDTTEAMTNQGDEVSILDPTTILRWINGAIQNAATHGAASWWLTTIASFYLFLAGTALWLLRFALSGQWLVVIAQVARPVYGAVTTVANQLYLGPITITLCAIVGGFHILRGHAGRGRAIIATGLVFTILLLTVFADPIGDLYSDHGLLAWGRSIGFSIAQATRQGPYMADRPLADQVNMMLGDLITAGVRHPLQVMNFGYVTDDVPGCAQAWSTAISTGVGKGPGPAHAMGDCGAGDALLHAQQLSGDDTGTSLAFLLTGLTFSVFNWYVSVSIFLVGLQAAFFGTVVGPSFMIGMTGLAGRAMAYAKHSAWQLLVHAAELAAYTTFLGIVVIWMAWTLTSPMLGTGTVTVMPRMLIVMLVSIIAIFAFRFMDRQFHADGIGTIGHTIHAASGRVLHSGRSAGQAAAQRADAANSMLGKLRERRRGRPGDSSTDDPDQASKSTTPAQFDTFRPRPQSRPASVPASATSAAAKRTTSAAAGGEGAAARTATATRTAGAVAETAELVAAPEVVVGAAVAHGARKAVHKHHEKRQQRAADQQDNTAAPRSTAAPDRAPATSSAGSADVGHDTLAPRAAGLRRQQRDQSARVGTEQRRAQADSDQHAQPAGPATPLGFDAVPHTNRPSNGRGDQ